MTGFAQTFIGKSLLEFVAWIDKDLAAAIKVLQPSIDAVTAVIKDKGVQDVETVVAAMATAAAGALTGGASAAGQAALAAAGTALVAEATDALHAIATAQVTAAKETASAPK